MGHCTHSAFVANDNGDGVLAIRTRRCIYWLLLVRRNLCWCLPHWSRWGLPQPAAACRTVGWHATPRQPLLVHGLHPLDIMPLPWPWLSDFREWAAIALLSWLKKPHLDASVLLIVGTIV